MRDYSEFDGTALAEMVRKGDVAPAELVEDAIARAERHNPKLNAIVHEAFDAARAEAKKKKEGPFAGVPFLIKDLGPKVAGMPRSSGSKFVAHVVDSEDSGLVARYRASGLIFLGKTNTPEYGITGTTEGVLLGPCRNPWNTEHIFGGSSGGSASAVAAGIVPMAHASDGLGSIRIPAACCGLVGLKVTRDRNPNLPDAAEYAMGFVVDHVVTRTVRDSAAMLDITGVPEPGSPYQPPAKARPYLDEIKASPGRMKIAFSSRTASGRPIDPEVQGALERLADDLRHLGHDVFHRDLEIDWRALYAARAPVSGANFAAEMRRRIDMVGREPEPDELEGLTWASLKGGRKVTGEQAFWGFQELRALTRQIVRQFEDFDVLLTPVLGTPPPRIGHIDVMGDLKELNRRQSEAFPFTPPFNFTGQPSLSLPLAMSKSGLPMGMMFTGRYADEATLFRLAAQLERELPWAGRKPAVWN